jgi:hypothetical protein
MSTTVIDQAENVGGVVSAARMREKFMRQRANSTDDEKVGALGDAIGTLELRFPELEDLPAGGAEKFARERGHGTGARSPSHEGRRRHQPAKQPDAKPLEKAAHETERKLGKQGKRSAGGGNAARRRSSPSASPKSRGTADRLLGGLAASSRRRYRETGIPQATSSATQIGMSALGATVGLSAAYLLLSSAEQRGAGGHALPELLQTITAGIRRFIAPQDFFGSAPAGGVVAGAAPVRELASPGLVNKVIRHSGKYPGEAGRGGGGKTLGNPGAELVDPPRRRPHNHRGK